MSTPRPGGGHADRDLCVRGHLLRRYADSVVRAHGAAHGRTLVASRRDAYPHTDDGVEARRIFHALRSRASANVNGQFKGIFDGEDAVPTRGVRPTQRFVLGAVLVYQRALLHGHAAARDLRVGLKPLLKAA